MSRYRSLRAGAARAVLAVTALLLGACAAYGPSAIQRGDSEAAVRASMGSPSARYALPDGGTRLAYARGPLGRHTWMIDLDAQQRVVAISQALGSAQFAQLPTGIDRDELLRRLGPPAERRLRGLKPGELWSWRYPTNDCLWFQAELDGDGIFLGGSYGIDPRCDVGEPSWP